MIKYFKTRAQLKKERDLAYQIAQAYQDILMMATPEDLQGIQDFIKGHKDDPNIEQVLDNMIAASEILI